MSYADGLIPTFQPGQRVRVVLRPNPEYSCERCGYIHGTTPEHQQYPAQNTMVGTVAPRPLTATVKCANCGSIRDQTEGEFSIALDTDSVMTYRVAPYTWLTPIEGAA